MIDFMLNIPKSEDPRRIDLEGRVLVAHQPEFLPWLGFISKATMGDVYFILDNSQFKKKYFENRNKIRCKGGEGWLWLNVPCKGIRDHRVNLFDVDVADDKKWQKKILKQIKLCYSQAPYYGNIFEELSDVISRPYNKLVELNIEIIKYAFNKFHIKIPVYRTSELIKKGFKIEGKNNELIFSMCKVVNANVYVFGKSGRDYYKKESFAEKNILPVFQTFEHPVYKQVHGSFLPYMSFIDLLFNYSEESAIEILMKSNYKVG